MKKLTEYSQLDKVFYELSNAYKKALEENFVGLYLQGSLAIGDFDLTSDADFVVIINQDLIGEEVKKVQGVHTSFRNRGSRWVQHLEYSFFPLSKLRQHSSPYKNGKRDDSEGRRLWYFDNGSRTIERNDHDNTLVVRWTLREKGITVLGPEPKTLIDPISANDLRKEIRETFGWGYELLANSKPYENRFFQAFFVLNYIRMMQDLVEGKITSKKKAIEWAKKNLDSKWSDLIDYSWEQRKDENISIHQPVDPKKYQETMKFVKYILEKVKEIKF